jgi:serine protease 16
LIGVASANCLELKDSCFGNSHDLKIGAPPAMLLWMTATIQVVNLSKLFATVPRQNGLHVPRARAGHITTTEFESGHKSSPRRSFPNMGLLLILVAVVLTSVVQGIPRWHQGKLVHDHTSEYTQSDDRTESFFVQKLDHFNRQVNGTFKQRYFINDTHWSEESKKNPIVFLCVGGEGPPLDRTVLSASVHCNDMVELAPKYGALMFALEHRYYGPSDPFGDFATANLQWLNSEQALGDIASFHTFASEKFSLPANTRWVTWGGSYPGMMAALARLKLPQLIYASVSSSSPLQASVDMPGYNNVVAASMAAVDVGGSQACLDTIVEGHKVVGEKLLTVEGRSELEDLFNICTPGALQDPKNREQFAGDGVVYLPAQSNDPSCTTPYCDIASICVLMIDETAGTPIERLASLSKAQHATCSEPSYDLMIKYVSSETNPERSWLYQTCTEWGFYQTCEEGTECPYTQGLHTLSVDYDICLQAFGVTKQQVDYQIQHTNTVYGGSNIQGTRIMFPNGQIDPWQANGVLTPPNAQEPTLLVEGASHHFWTHPSLPTDPPAVRNARTKIWQQVGDWLEE